jgi:deoxyribodipyrimidine photolyase-related protein
MNSITIIFPHQLYEQHPAVAKNRKIILVEEWLFFRQYSFHKLKLVLHRASMKCYQQFLTDRGFSVDYIESTNRLCDIRELISFLSKKNVQLVHYADTVDNWLERRIKKACDENQILLTRHDNPNFLNRMDDVTAFFDEKQTYFQTDFYKWQRQKRSILMEPGGKPMGGKWSYDTENRKKLAKTEQVPVVDCPPESSYVREARTYVEENFRTNYGESVLPFPNSFYPINFQEAKNWLESFLQHRFYNFGIYEDAIVKDDHYLFHSVLTPVLNIGLLQPHYIISRALEVAFEYDIPINSLEGFIRQIMGWREYIRIVYEREGSVQRTTNYWQFSRKIPDSFWRGNTSIVPVDNTITKVLKTGYSHHIERLMIMGNFFVLCEFDPDEVYRWFMEMYIDAYDWVMVPNVYGMTQFADGGLMMTKPYISSSNYILKMSNYGTHSGKNAADQSWQQIWDALFWRFMHVHRSFFEKNPRIGMLLRTFDKMPAAKQKNHLDVATTFLASLDQ